MEPKEPKKSKILCAVLLLVSALLLISCCYLYTELDDNRNDNSILRKKIETLNTQIEARNSVIDKDLGINLVEPLSLSKNFEGVKQKYKGTQQTVLNVISDDMAKEITVPLYTPDGLFFGEISYAAYTAIVYDKLKEYEIADDKEMQILHSYMNYITLNPGLSITKYQ